jgi:hypothetical protein
VRAFLIPSSVCEDPTDIADRISKDVPSASAAKEPTAKLYDVGNVTLFLAGDMGENLSGVVVARDGSYRDM